MASPWWCPAGARYTPSPDNGRLALRLEVRPKAVDLSLTFHIAKDPVHIHDLHATILNQLGVDHTKLTFKYQGRHFRLTDVHGEVVKPLLA